MEGGENLLEKKNKRTRPVALVGALRPRGGNTNPPRRRRLARGDAAPRDLGYRGGRGRPCGAEGSVGGDSSALNEEALCRRERDVVCRRLATPWEVKCWDVISGKYVVHDMYLWLYTSHYHEARFVRETSLSLSLSSTNTNTNTNTSR